MDREVENLKNIENEIVSICLKNLNKINDRYSFFSTEDENEDSISIKERINRINDNMLIKFSFNREIIQKYTNFKDYYSPHDIDVINLLLKSISVQTRILLHKYKENKKILKTDEERLEFISNNQVRNKNDYLKKMNFINENTKKLLNHIFDLILEYNILNMKEAIRKYAF
jgi:hypothetical protein